MATNKCTSVQGHFNGHADALKQYTWHRLMQHVQDYIGSHWMPSSGNYLLHITPVATRATSKHTMMKKYTYFAGCFNGHSNALVRYHAHCLMEEIQGYTRSHWTLPLGKYYVQYLKRDIPTPVCINIFHCQHAENGCKAK